MFVDNPTGIACTLARGRLTDEFAALSLNLESQCTIAAHGELVPLPVVGRAPFDPPDLGRALLWHGCSATAWGLVRGPARAPYARHVRLSVGSFAHELDVLGARRWIRGRPGALEASPPEPFAELALDWSLAFGGWFDVPPGLAPGTDLPHPGGRVHYVYNPDGIGFYENDAVAEGRPLPQIERADDRVERATDRPCPGGLAPCPKLVGLRLPSAREVAAMATAGGQSTRATGGGAARAGPALRGVLDDWPGLTGDPVLQALRLQHHAPGALVLDDVRPGTAVRLEGLGTGPLTFSVPSPPVQIRVRRGKHRQQLSAKVRAVHVDAEARSVRVAFGHLYGYPPARPPSWIEVSRSPGA